MDGESDEVNRAKERPRGACCAAVGGRVHGADIAG
jgi:hypothetical protein